MLRFMNTIHSKVVVVLFLHHVREWWSVSLVQEIQYRMQEIVFFPLEEEQVVEAELGQTLLLHRKSSRVRESLYSWLGSARFASR